MKIGRARAAGIQMVPSFMNPNATDTRASKLAINSSTADRNTLSSAASEENVEDVLHQLNARALKDSSTMKDVRGRISLLPVISKNCVTNNNMASNERAGPSKI